MALATEPATANGDFAPKVEPIQLGSIKVAPIDAKSHSFCQKEDDNFDRAAICLASFNAQNYLQHEFSHLSAKGGAGRNWAIGFLLLFCLGLICALNEKSFLFYCFIASFIGAPITIFRFWAIFSAPLAKPNFSIHNNELAPIYTVLVAVYKEASVINSLVDALNKLHWPKDKIDLIFLCEEGDDETISAIRQNDSAFDYRLLTLPKGFPQTKPRALQAGLDFAKGRFLVVYDAEDKPMPMQLVEAYEAFSKGGQKLGVVQAPLIAWNHNESWVAGQFALEYATWFRVILPALAKISGYIPLGGTSNHFRVKTLKEVGGWDPYNVTEDADLGARLCLKGYKSSIIGSPTFEEAPPKLIGWIRQRSRWIHGHMQTIGIHLSRQTAKIERMPKLEFLAFVVAITSSPLNVALRAPIILAAVIAYGGLGLNGYFGIILGFTILTEALISIVAAFRDGRISLIFQVFTLPFYWLLQIPAFFRAIFNLITRPFVWEKTDHGDAARKV